MLYRLLKNNGIYYVSGIIFIAGYFPDFIERFYSKGFYPIISLVLRGCSSLFPFAIGDIFYVAIGLFILIDFIRFFKQYSKQHKFIIKLLNKIFKVMVIFYAVFKLVWALNYNRPQIYHQLKLSNNTYQEKELLALTDLFRHRLDSLQHIIDQKQLKFTNNSQNLFENSQKSYQNLAVHYPQFRYRQASIKKAISSKLTSYMGIEGYYNPFSGEANINMLLPDFVLPFVVEHEIAHQVGIAREDEANLIAYLSCIHSDDLLTNYSAYYNLFRNILLELRLKYPNTYQNYRQKLSKELLNKFKTEREFWLPYNGAMSSYMNASFDQLLKLNHQEKGIDSYQDIVLWLYNYHLKNLKK